MALTRACQNTRMPARAVHSARAACKRVRRMPRPTSLFGNGASVSRPSSRKRIPANGSPSSEPISTPSARKAETPSGIRPSPQALSIGLCARSATITSRPCRRAARAVASPAGPPPITSTSVSGAALATTARAIFQSKSLIPLPIAGRGCPARGGQFLKTSSSTRRIETENRLPKRRRQSHDRAKSPWRNCSVSRELPLYALDRQACSPQPDLGQLHLPHSRYQRSACA